MTAKLRLAQIDGTLANFDDNLQKHLHYIDAAIADKCDAIVFPELSLTGYNVQDAAQDLAMRSDDARLEPLRDRSKHISILCGAIELSDDFAVYNAAFFFEDGTGSSVHRKVYLPTYGMFEELRYFAAGDRIAPFTSRRLGKVGVAICEDNWHLSVPYLLAMQGAKLLISMDASPLRFSAASGELKIAEMRADMTRTYAALLSVYTVFCNRVGNEDGVSFWGGSEVVGADGSTVVKAPLYEEATLDALYDLNAVKRARLASSHFLDEDVLLTLSELQRITRR